MAYITIKNHQVIEQNLPKGCFLEHDTLRIEKHFFKEEAIKITWIDDASDTFHILVEEGANVKIISEVLNGDHQENTFDLSLTLKKNSHVKYLLVSELKSENAHLNHQFHVGKDATLEVIGGFVSNVLTAKLTVDLLEENATVKMRAVAMSSDEHQQNVDVFIRHQAPYTFGDMTNIGIANKKGRIVLNGVEKIFKGMHQANAFQTLKGIITSDDAMVEVNPILLIDEYDVKAGHGATIGKIESDVLYYLQSRGLTKQEAERLVIMGFLQPVIDEIEDEPLRTRFVSVINERL